MIQRIVSFCNRLIESGWLMAVIAVPLFFNPYSSRVFEADKTYILIAIFCLMAMLSVLRRLGDGPYKIPNRGIVWLACSFIAVYCVSSILSISPDISFGGYYLREEGWLTLCAYAGIFLFLVYNLRDGIQIDRIITAVILVGFIVALYGIFQQLGRDIVPWASDVKTRVTSTFGGPIFAGAFLIMVIPLTLYRLIDKLESLTTEYGSQRGRRSSLISTTIKVVVYRRPVVLVYILILLAQVWCVIATQSRGPFIGLMAGILFFLVLYAISRGYKKLLLATVAVVVLIGVFVLLLNIEGSPLSKLKPRMGRLGEMTQTETGSGKVRLLIWEGAVSILSAEPVRLIFGYGLETMFPLYHKHTPGQFARYEGTFAVADHSHNDTFDLLITGGIAGLLVYLAIIAAIIYLALKKLELVRGSPAWFFLACLVGILAGIFIPYVLTGKLIFLGLGVPFGLLLVVAIWLVVTGFRSDAPSLTLPTCGGGKGGGISLLIIALLAGIISHFVEIQFGIGVTSTRLYFWVYLALLAVLTSDSLTIDGYLNDHKGRCLPEEPCRQRGLSSLMPTSLIQNYLQYSLLIGLILSIFVFELIKRRHLLEGIPDNFYVIMGAIWALTGLFILLIYTPAVGAKRLTAGYGRLQLHRQPIHPPKQKDGETGIGAYFNYYLLVLGVSGLTAGIFYLVYTSLLGDATALESLINLVYIWLGFVMALLAFILPAVATKPEKPRPYPAAICILLIIPALCFVVYTVCLKNAYADMYCRQADNLEKANKLPEAIASYRKAIELAPKTDYYYSASALARAYQKAGNYAEALESLKKAQALNPLNQFHIRDTARLYSDWAETFKDKPEERTSRIKESLRYYDELIKATLNNPQPYREQGDVYCQLSDFQTAIARYRQSLEKDDQVGLTWFMLARAYHQINDAAKSIEAFETAYKLQIKQARFELGRLGEEYFNSGRYDDSIAVNLALTRLEPLEPRHCQNLALIYEKAGKPDEAAKYRQKASELNH